MTDFPFSESSISFHAEDIPFQLAQEERLDQWLRKSIAAEGGILGELSFIFCSDDYLHQLNVKYLQHDTLTDVITFPYDDQKVAGDIFISIDRVRENATLFDSDFTKELHRVMVHGVLHLIGYGDKNPEDQQVMRAKEDFYLHALRA